VRLAEAAAHPIIMPSPGHGLHALIGRGWTILPAVGIAAVHGGRWHPRYGRTNSDS
jgi:hypothetical protein